jgi:hypothetical protein
MNGANLVGASFNLKLWAEVHRLFSAFFVANNQTNGYTMKSLTHQEIRDAEKDAALQYSS